MRLVIRITRSYVFLLNLFACRGFFLTYKRRKKEALLSPTHTRALPLKA